MSSCIGQLPIDLFKSKEVFQSVLKDGWDCLSEDKKKSILDKCLPRDLLSTDAPNTPDASQAKEGSGEETVEMLLSDQLTRFDSDPLDSLYFQMRVTRLSPDINKIVEDVKRLKVEAYRLQEKEYQLILWKEVLSRRRQLMLVSLKCSQDDIIRLDNKSKTKNGHINGIHELKTQSMKINKMTRRRACLRYKKELQEIHSIGTASSIGINYLSSDDEDIIGGVDLNVFDWNDYEDDSKASKLSLTTEATEARYNHLIQEYMKRNENGLSVHHHHHNNSTRESFHVKNRKHLSEIIARVAGTVDDFVLVTPPPKLNSCKATVRKKPKRKRKTTGQGSKKIKIEPGTSSIDKPLVTGIEVMSRKLDLNLNSIKKESASVFDFDDDSPSECIPPKITTTSPAVSVTVGQHQETLPNVSILPVMNTGVTITPSLPLHSGSAAPVMSVTATPVSTTSEVTVTTTSSSTSGKKPKASSPQIATTPMTYEKEPACFFSLIRDIFQVHASVSDYRLTLHRLEELVKDKLKLFNPSLGWSHEYIQSAMNFLSYATDKCKNNGLDLKDSSPCSQESNDTNNIPLVDYKEKNQQWQWIGVCRDSDDVLIKMCNEWLLERDKQSSIIDPSQPVPPSICPTEWTVKPSTEEERRLYRQQEAIRYNNPNKAYTFKVHSYSSVVGPVKGCGIAALSANCIPSASSSSLLSSPNKAREHSLLVSDRPPFVTLLSLVRDAAARLPNGEGTRSDIVQLLKDSQYLLPSVSDQQVNQIVSGALDRLHYEKDPCVKYDVNRKLWIYLHRNRREEDFERLHEMQVAAAKAKKSLNRKPTAGKIIAGKGSSTPLSSPPTPKAQAVKKLPETTTASSLKPISCVNQTRISVSPLVSKACVSSGSQDNSPVSFSKTTATDKNILNILSKVNQITAQKQQQQQNSLQKKKISKQETVQIVPKPFKEAIGVGQQSQQQTVKQIVGNIVSVNTGNSSVLTAMPSGGPVRVESQVKQVRPGLPMIHSSKLQQKQPMTGNRQTFIHSTGVNNNIRQIVGNPSTNIQGLGPGTNSQQASVGQSFNIQSTQQQTVTVGNSLLFNRGNQVVFTNGGRQYMMTPASSGGQQFVAIQSHSSPASNLPAGTPVMATGPGGQTIRGQVIKILSVPNNNNSNASRVMIPNQTGQFVARIITRPAGVNASGSTTNQIMIPSNAGLQNVIFAPATQQTSSSQPLVGRMQQQQEPQVNTVPFQVIPAASAPSDQTTNTLPTKQDTSAAS